MASIQEKCKGRKIISYKFRVCVGRDQAGKQIFKSTTWYPPPDLTPAISRKAAKLAAEEWEKRIKQEFESGQAEYYKISPLYSAAKGGMINIFRLFIYRTYQLLKPDGYTSFCINLESL